MKKQVKSNLFVILFAVSFLAAFPFIIQAIQPKNPESTSVPPQTDAVSTEQPSQSTTAAVTGSNELAFSTVDASYFDDALFIGDSRTVGLSEYSGLTGADYFATVGMSLYKIQKETVSVPNVGKLTLSELLGAKKYGKIYIMLGINDLGYDLQKTIERYRQLIEEVQKAQPAAVVYVCANLHVTKVRSENDKIFSNANIDRFNHAVEALAAQKSAYYIDVNTIFDDGNGNLKDAYTSDSTHVLGRYYKEWGSWLCTRAVVKK